ncbi:hypothetical protein SAMN02746041_01098 [Desulfacinum hydrothermale DSM 13146]|uniref:Uncharacterized protein n=1 Tax=Desulfacinum hydrothermale DSM 13146 TaxID=1121390 RepID=A0A1W1XBY8_9BACT|nr:hypothetical protein [Desulfacinum hydrothermale]SMC21031.1 hypothetical protein SAMN02746041_01098 [Desulfacinum hydrothermale DSM 13146]
MNAMTFAAYTALMLAGCSLAVWAAAALAPVRIRPGKPHGKRRR